MPKVIAMILAGGKGTRLQQLTKKVAKPAVTFAGKYRIIDFPLSNCANSGIDTVGVLTQYESTFLDSYLGSGEKWGLNGVHSLMATLAPRQTEEGAQWYKGTADAITQNIDFLDENEPDYVLILSGDHIYKTRYNDMIDLHIDTNADATISVIEVDLEEASRFGIMVTNDKDEVVEFQEKPRHPKSTLASMGIYVFSWKVLRRYLKEDAKDENSDHDFGKNIIPKLLADGKKIQAYRFKGYWRDVGTLSSLHQANMDVLDSDEINFYNGDKVYTQDYYTLPQYVGPNANVKHSLVTQGSMILGSIEDCVISSNVLVEEKAKCTRCVIMENAQIKAGAKVHNAIVGPGTVIEAGEEINLDSDEITLIYRKGNK